MRSLLALLLLTACADASLTGSETELAVEPAALVFEHVWVGHPDALPLALANQGRATQPIAITLEGPFRLDESPSELSGAARRELQVRFAPNEPGSFEGAIRIAHERGEVVVPLRGTAEQPPACGDSECHEGLFDPELGTCRQVPLADGTNCENVCLEAPSCQQGRCVGKPKSCDDGNFCTTDACDPVKGCVHVDTTSQCPQPASRCRVAICSPESGCGEADAADYTPCGAVSCTEANVCFSGACMAFEPPDGFPCAPATPCREGGTCKAKRCVQPPPGRLPISWTWKPPEKHYSAFFWIADAEGNVYVAAAPFADAESCAVLYAGSQAEIERCIADFDAGEERIVSLTPDGALRWSRNARGIPEFVDHDRLWLTHGRQNTVLNAADGTGIATGASLGWLLGVGEALVLGSQQPTSGEHILSAYDVREGTLLWSRTATGVDSPYREVVLLPEDRVLLVVRGSEPSEFELVLLDAAGNELSRQPGDDLRTVLIPSRQLPVFSTRAGRLIGFDAQSLAPSWEVAANPTGWALDDAVGSERLFLVRTGPGAPAEERLESRSMSDGAIAWSVTLDRGALGERVSSTSLWLTNRRTVAVVQHALGESLLSERRELDGSLLYACPFEVGDTPMTIGRGRLIARTNAGVTAYAVPGLGLAKSGWVSRDGNPGRSKRPW